MDAAGIDLQVLSHTVPGPGILDATRAVPAARAANDALAEAVAAYPHRFAGFAALPTPDPRAAARELERAVSELGMRGALLNGLTHGQFLDHPCYAPLLECAAALGVPLYLHPSRPPEAVTRAYYDGLSPLMADHLATAAWGWHSETALHLLRIIVSGVFDRFPDLQVIVGHMGEMIPFALARINTVLTPVADHLRQPVADYFQTNIWLTTSGYTTFPPLQCALSVVGGRPAPLCRRLSLHTQRTGACPARHRAHQPGRPREDRSRQRRTPPRTRRRRPIDQSNPRGFMNPAATSADHVCAAPHR
ncbi:amidohydrolase family protein [Nonomuraea sp. NBC_00507]|uniref:amidohydrolase family protein n=1 Tax=Nonomuraea sp. NBC_00507 TaxID=2976002 RepID=UPI002E179EF7